MIPPEMREWYGVWFPGFVKFLYLFIIYLFIYLFPSTK